MLIDTNYGSVSGWRRSIGAQLAFLFGGIDRFTTVESSQVRRLVFVCLGNIHRSPFAEAVARRRGVHAASVGLNTSTGAAASSRSIALAAEFCVDLTPHAATDFTDYEFEAGDLLLVPETGHVSALINRGVPPRSIALLGHWASPHRIHLQDPNMLSDAYHRTCFALIHSAVNKLVDQLTAEQSPCVRGG